MIAAPPSLLRWLLALPLLGAVPAWAKGGPNLPFSDTVTVDRVRLRVSLSGRPEVRAMAGEARLPTRNPKELARSLKKELEKTPCPVVRAEANAVLLRCNIRKLRVSVSKRRGRRYLEIAELRSQPQDDEESRVPLFPLDPVQFGFGGPCPGDNPASRGECAMQAGELTTAAAEFREAVDGKGKEAREVAALRLGDLAMGVGDVASARGWYLRAGATGPIARLAYVRVCEIEGTCFAPLDGDRRRYYPFDLGGVSGTIRDELSLRAARAYTFEGNPAAAVRILLEEGYKPCASHPALCVGVEREALRDRERPSPEALAIYLTSPFPRDEAAVFEHATLAAEHAAVLGAPAYGASLLAATLNLAGERRLEKHLLRSAELYLDANDRARARAVTRFADQNVKNKRRSYEQRWNVVRDRLVAGAAPVADVQRVRSEVPAELKEARALIERAQAILSQGAAK